MEVMDILQLFLKRKGFQRIKEEREIFWLRQEEEAAALVHIVSEAMPGQQKRSVAEIDVQAQEMVRRLMLCLGRPVERVTLLLTHDIPTQGMVEEIAPYPDMWYLDWKDARVFLYERQRADFLDMREELEQTLRQYQEGEHRRSMQEMRKIFQPVTTALVVANVLIFIILSIFGDVYDSGYMAAHGALVWSAVVEQHEYYRLLTCTFLHFGLEHLLSNMLMLLLIGYRLERIVGKVRYLLIYLFSGLGSSLLSLFFTLRSSAGAVVVSAGASGAIFGVMGGLLVLLYKDWRAGSREYVEEIRLDGIILMVVASIFCGFFSYGVDNMGHLGGLLTGIVVTAIATVGMRKDKKNMHRREM